MHWRNVKKAAEHRFGVNPHEVLGEPPDEFGHHPRLLLVLVPVCTNNVREVPEAVVPQLEQIARQHMLCVQLFHPQCCRMTNPLPVCGVRQWPLYTFGNVQF